jgi:hypothetical protein
MEGRLRNRIRRFSHHVLKMTRSSFRIFTSIEIPGGFRHGEFAGENRRIRRGTLRSTFGRFQVDRDAAFGGEFQLNMSLWNRNQTQ